MLQLILKSFLMYAVLMIIYFESNNYNFMLLIRLFWNQYNLMLILC